MDVSPSTPAAAERSQAEQKLCDVLEAFSAGRETPGSGSANALIAALAAALTVSVAKKTRTTDQLKYVSVQGTAGRVEVRAKELQAKLLALVDLDTRIFAPVIAMRRDRNRMVDPVLQDDAARKEIAATKRATESPIEIAQIAAEVAALAAQMLSIGFSAASGESHTALAAALAAVDGALCVARLNTRSIRNRVQRLNDPQLETDWLTSTDRRIRAIRDAARSLRIEEETYRQRADGDNNSAANPPVKRTARRS